MILAGDVGGTKTLLGLFEPDGVRPAQLAIDSFITADYPGLPEIIDAFLSAQPSRPHIERAAFGIAGPVINQTAQMTNVAWHVDAEELGRRLELRDARLLNDLEALAYSVPVLNDSELRPLQQGERHAVGNVAVIAAGTGLGTAFLHWIDGRHVPVASEGGHTDFAARTDREFGLARFLRGRYGRAEIEHVVSGPGLVNVSDFTHQSSRCPAGDSASNGPQQPAVISSTALNGACPHCVEALDIFVTAYGAVAGNFALAAVTRGGVFIGGGIAPRILAALERGAFIEAFRAKDPMTPLLDAMAVNVILKPDAGLLGAAVYASRGG
jgi:glucokinase